MKYTVKVNKVRKNEGNLRGFATVVFGKIGRASCRERV